MPLLNLRRGRLRQERPYRPSEPVNFIAKINRASVPDERYQRWIRMFGSEVVPICSLFTTFDTTAAFPHGANFVEVALHALSASQRDCLCRYLSAECCLHLERIQRIVRDDLQLYVLANGVFRTAAGKALPGSADLEERDDDGEDD